MLEFANDSAGQLVRMWSPLVAWRAALCNSGVDVGAIDVADIYLARPGQDDMLVDEPGGRAALLILVDAFVRGVGPRAMRDHVRVNRGHSDALVRAVLDAATKLETCAAIVSVETARRALDLAEGLAADMLRWGTSVDELVDCMDRIAHVAGVVWAEMDAADLGIELGAQLDHLLTLPGGRRQSLQKRARSALTQAIQLREDAQNKELLTRTELLQLSSCECLE